MRHPACCVCAAGGTMKHGIVIAFVLAVSLGAFAGKGERDYKEKNVDPAVKTAQTKYKEACGCSLSITVEDSLATTDELKWAAHVASYVAEGAPKYCTDAASKKAMCQMTSMTITKGAKAT